MTVRKLQQRRGWAWSIGVAIVKPLLLLTTKRTWIGGENIPVSGGFILVLNHISHLDPFMAAHVVYDHGRMPRYLAKSGLFKNKLLGFFLRSAGQIPVERLSKNAVGAYAAAVAAVRSGEAVVVYPEGTITRDPNGWPMLGKTGAARIALETGCPVIPVGQWGAQSLLAPYSKKPDLFPRKQITMKVGPPIDLADLAEQPRSAASIAEATDRIMTTIKDLVEDVRDEPAPAELFDPKKAGMNEIGNPNRKTIPGEDPA
ncbi:1-acyl-sn-glycerol-3-phosphate acyltransferase [Nocardioides sp. SR21]|uniref:lysophospholipid acyltransferase family protein n=1 Tax=Nocardioides sp. SR21 TaxID=2919501 RepID=UPI001FAA5E5B|nr:lysophospholipid acyltransferase family protein [Nocardioides sp. SR21]